MIHKTEKRRQSSQLFWASMYLHSWTWYNLVQFALTSRCLCEDTHVLIPRSRNRDTWPKGVKAAGGIRLLIRNLKSHEILGQAEEGSQKGPKDLYLLPEKMEVMGQNKQINQPNKKIPQELQDISHPLYRAQKRSQSCNTSFDLSTVSPRTLKNWDETVFPLEAWCLRSFARVATGH